MAVIVKINFIYIKKPYAYLHYALNVLTCCQNCRSSLLPYSAKNRQNDQVFNFVNINSISIKNQHAYRQYVHNMCTELEKHPLKL